MQGFSEDSSVCSHFKRELESRDLWEVFMNDTHAILSDKFSLKVKMLHYCFRKHVLRVEGSVDSEIYRTTKRFGPATYFVYSEKKRDWRSCLGQAAGGSQLIFC